MEPYIDACMLKLIARLDQAAEQGEAIDLGLWISFFVMDVPWRISILQTLRCSREWRQGSDATYTSTCPVGYHVSTCAMAYSIRQQNRTVRSYTSSAEDDQGQICSQTDGCCFCT